MLPGSPAPQAPGGVAGGREGNGVGESLEEWRERGTKRDRDRDSSGQGHGQGTWQRCCFLLWGDERFIRWDWKCSQVGNTGCQSAGDIDHPQVQPLVAAKPMRLETGPWTSPLRDLRHQHVRVYLCVSGGGQSWPHWHGARAPISREGRARKVKTNQAPHAAGRPLQPAQPWASSSTDPCFISIIAAPSPERQPIPWLLGFYLPPQNRAS